MWIFGIQLPYIPKILLSGNFYKFSETTIKILILDEILVKIYIRWICDTVTWWNYKTTTSLLPKTFIVSNIYFKRWHTSKPLKTKI